MARRAQSRGRHWSEASPLALECFHEIMSDVAPMSDAEDLAAWMLAKTANGTADELAKAFHLRIDPVVLPEGVCGFLVETYVRPQLSLEGEEFETVMLIPKYAKGTVKSLIVQHECVHHASNLGGRCHSHGQIWKATLALAYPKRLVKLAWARGTTLALRAAALFEMGTGPEWAAQARVEIESMVTRKRPRLRTKPRG